MMNKFRFTWIAWAQLGAIACSLPITLILTISGATTAIAEYHFTHAVHRYGAGNTSQAAGDVDSTISALGDSVPYVLPALEMKARIQIDNGEEASAKTTYAKILELDPDNPGARIGLASVAILEKEKDFEKWMELRDAGAGAEGAGALRLELDKAVEEARGELTKAVETAKSRGMGKLADAHVYLGVLHLLADPDKRPGYLEDARKEFLKALPESQSRPTEIPGRDACMRLFDGLGYVAYRESLDLWAKVDETRARLAYVRDGLVPPKPGSIPDEILAAANLAAVKSFDAARYFLTACHYGEMWRGAFVNFETAMTRYLPRVELLQTEPDLQQFLDMAIQYAQYKEDFFRIVQRLFGDKATENRFEIKDDNRHEFDKESYPFCNAVAIAATNRQSWSIATEFLSKAGDSLKKVKARERQRCEHILNRLYFLANRVVLDPLYLRDNRALTDLINGAEKTVNDGLRTFGQEQGMTDERKAWLWVSLSYIRLAAAVIHKRDQEIIKAWLLLDDEHAGKYVQDDWLKTLRRQIKWHTIDVFRDARGGPELDALLGGLKEFGLPEVPAPDKMPPYPTRPGK
ncbi:MAG: hypothetical protein HY720_25985 [Planctomycetes bacterium]|nr:hypothetical protein [Planctomycetota bacterium]